jgi:hypothetical protein
MSVTAPNYIYPPIESDPGALYKGFQDFMQTWIPGWKPYSGELDDWLGRVFAGIQASLSELASDVSTQIYRYFGANIVNVQPDDATPSVGTITITVQDVNGPYTIPAFTQMSFPDASGQLQGFETTTDVTVPNGSTTATNVFVQAMTPGALGNACSGSGDLDSTGITFVTALTLSAPTANGTDAESDADYLNRLTSLFTTLTPTPITPVDFTVIAATQAGVSRAFTLPTFNPANWTTTGATHTTKVVDGFASTANIPLGATITGAGIPANTYVTGITSGTAITISNAATATASGVTFTIGGQLNQGGYVTSWVMGATDVLTTPQMSAIQTVIQAECLANIVYSVEAPTKNTIAVTAAVVAWPGVDATATQTAVTAAVTSFLEPQNFGQNSNAGAVQSGPTTQAWLNDTVVRIVVLENLIMNVPGVHYISSININGVAADFPLAGIVPITEPGTMTITVTNG